MADDKEKWSCGVALLILGLCLTSFSALFELPPLPTIGMALAGLALLCLSFLRLRRKDRDSRD